MWDCDLYVQLLSRAAHLGLQSFQWWLDVPAKGALLGVRKLPFHIVFLALTGELVWAEVLYLPLVFLERKM